MNLEDMKNDWQARDRQLQQSIQLNTRWLRESFIDRRSASVRRWALFGFWVELPVYILTMGALALFIADHISEIRFMIPALLMLGWSAAMLSAVMRQLHTLHGIEFSEAVIAVQKQLTTLKISRLKTFKWGLFSGMFIWWVPLLIVVVKATLNLDLYEIAPGFLVFQTIGTAALIGLLVWVSRRFADRLQRSTFLAAFLKRVAGRDLVMAGAFLEELSSFEQAEPPQYANV
jgi:hypothetical protein